MAELDFAGLVSELEKVLRADGRMDGVHVTQEPDERCMEHCPAVAIDILSCDHSPRRIVAALAAGQPDDLLVDLQLRCYEFSVQGAADAARRRDALVSKVVDVIRDHHTVNNRVDFLQVRRIQFQWAPGQAEGSLYAVALVSMTGQARA